MKPRQAEFEAWAEANGFRVRLRDDKTSPDLYFHYETEQRWKCWQAARAAALEEAAAECERMRMYPGGHCEAPAHQNVWDAATAIRALATQPQQEGA